MLDMDKPRFILFTLKNTSFRYVNCCDELDVKQQEYNLFQCLITPLIAMSCVAEEYIAKKRAYILPP